MSLPLDQLSDARDLSIEDLAARLDAAVARLPARPIVLLGSGVAATVCLASRSVRVTRVVAVDPRLDSEGGKVLTSLVAPTTVVLGPVAGQADPSKTLLEAHPRIALHRVADTTPGPGGEAPPPWLEIVLEACRRAAGDDAYDPRKLDEVLLEATPLAAGDLAYWGPEPETFAAAYLARSPATRMVDPEAGDFDVLVLGEAPPHERLARWVRRLRPGGATVARWRMGPAAAQDPPRLNELGLRASRAPNAGAALVVRLDATPPRRLFVQVCVLAPAFMDARTRLPARWLASATDLQVDYQVLTLAHADLAPDTPKVLILQRPKIADLPAWARWTSQLADKGWVVVFELDDHPTLIQDVATPGQAPPDLLADFRALGCVHAVQTSTEGLAQAFRPHNGEVAAFANCVFELGPERAAAPPARIFYGALSRTTSACAVAAALAPFTQAFPPVEFVVVGDRAFHDDLPTTSKRLYPFLSYEGYLALLGRSSVCLSPLEPGGGREFKSDIKYLEAARSGVVTIASPTAYEGAVADGVTGFIARELADWPKILTRLFSDPPLLASVGAAAREDVRSRRMFATQIEARRAWYWDLWRRRDELNAARARRLADLRLGGG